VCDTENFSVDESWLSRQPVATERIRSLASLRDSLLRRKQPLRLLSAKRRKGVRAVRRCCQTRYSRIHPRLEDQVTEDQQESLQNYRSLNRSRLTTFLNDPRKHDFELRKFPNSKFGFILSSLFSIAHIGAVIAITCVISITAVRILRRGGC